MGLKACLLDRSKHVRVGQAASRLVIVYTLSLSERYWIGIGPERKSCRDTKQAGKKAAAVVRRLPTTDESMSVALAIVSLYAYSRQDNQNK